VTVQTGFGDDDAVLLGHLTRPRSDVPRARAAPL
jgi:hypothetical protein